MHIHTQIERVGIFADRKVTKRETKRLMKQGLNMLLRYWHKNFLPRHFGQSARLIYPKAVEKRTRKYRRDKLRRKGHSKNLVWSGAMAASVLGPPKVTGSSNRATIHLRYDGPRTLERLEQFDRELSAINQREDRVLSRVFGRWFRRRIEGVKARKVLKIAA